MSDIIDRSNMQIVSGTLHALEDVAYNIRYGSPQNMKEACKRLDLIKTDIRAITDNLNLGITESLKKYSIPFDIKVLKEYYHVIKKRRYSTQLIREIHNQWRKFSENAIQPERLSKYAG